MPTILLAPDKFKGSLSAQAVCAALQKGIQEVSPGTQVAAYPMADGGDGSLAVLATYLKAERIAVEVADPLFRPIMAHYLLAGQTAYIELAAASGLVLLPPAERSAVRTTSFGTGQLIADALRRGATTVYLCIGGSATNDGGIGMATALGYRLLDQTGRSVVPIGGMLSHIAQIDTEELLFDLPKIKFNVLCDVDNPLLGPLGASRVYAPQKGATPAEIARLDTGLAHLARLWQQQLGISVARIPGAGAAGGLGAGALAFLGAELVSGIGTFVQWTGIAAALDRADLLITGEGQLDEQSLRGKVVGHLTRLAQAKDIPVVVICGDSTLCASTAAALGIHAVYTIRSVSATLAESMNGAADKVEQLARRAVADFI